MFRVSSKVGAVDREASFFVMTTADCDAFPFSKDYDKTSLELWRVGAVEDISYVPWVVLLYCLQYCTWCCTLNPGTTSLLLFLGSKNPPRGL